jgi:predicted lipid-binding transport protein (Tim44 family)
MALNKRSWHLLRVWLAWALVIGVLFVAAEALARPGGGSSFSGGSSSHSSGSFSSSSSSSSDDDFPIDLLIFILELCVDYPQIGIPLLIGFILFYVVKSSAGNFGVIFGGVSALGAVGGSIWLAFTHTEIGLICLGGLVLIGVGLAIYGSHTDSKHEDWTTVPNTVGPMPPRRPFPNPRPTTITPEAQLEGLRDVDPEFSIVLFEDFLYALYTEAQTARGKKELDRLGPYLSADARSTLLEGAAELTAVKDIVVGSATISSTARNSDRVECEVEFETNYTEVSASGQEVGRYTKERWNLFRKPGAKSRAPAKARVFSCPSCGAPLEQIRDNTCSFCNKRVDTGEFDWVVAWIRVLATETRGPVLTNQPPERGTNTPTLAAPDLQQKVAALHAKDPAFQEAAFRNRLGLIFETMQKAWSTQEWEQARPFLSDRLFQSQQYWIDAYKKQGLRNLLDHARITGTRLVKATSDKHYDALTVRVFATGLDYVVDGNQHVVCGSRNTERPYSEYWTLIRGAEAKGAARNVLACPHCGAELKITMAGDCEFCHAHVTAGEFDWVLSRIEQDETYKG